MAFSDFKYPAALRDLGLTLATDPDLFAAVPPVPPGPLTRVALPIGRRLGAAAHTELSRTVWQVGPVLADLWARYGGQLTLIAGAEFAADPDAKLTGYVDFVLGRGPQTHVVAAPVLVIFEAKRDSIPDGLGQCIAGMVGAQRFNRREGTPVDPVYGCATTGSLWKFLKLSGAAVTLDQAEYTLSEVDKLLGILTHIVGPPPLPADGGAATLAG